MKQSTLTGLFGGGAEANGAAVPAEGTPQPLAKEKPVRRILLCLQGKGDYAVANLVHVVKGLVDDEVRTRGYFVPPRDGPTYLRLEPGAYQEQEGSKNPPDHEFDELQQFYKEGNFARVSDLQLSQAAAPTTLDRKTAIGNTMACSDAVVMIGTTASFHTQTGLLVQSVAKTLQRRVLKLAVGGKGSGGSKGAGGAKNTKGQVQRWTRELCEFVDSARGDPTFQGHVMVVNLLSGTRDAHLQRLHYLLPPLLGIPMQRYLDYIRGGTRDIPLKEVLKEANEMIKCRFASVPNGRTFRKHNKSQ